MKVRTVDSCRVVGLAAARANVQPVVGCALLVVLLVTLLAACGGPAVVEDGGVATTGAAASHAPAEVRTVAGPGLQVVDAVDGVSASALQRAEAELRRVVGDVAGELVFAPSAELLPEGALIEGARVLRPLQRWYALWYGPVPAEFRGEPERIEVVNLLMQRTPWVELAQDGTFTVRWETLEGSEAGRVYWGVPLPDQAVAYPRYRNEGVSEVGEDGRSHTYADSVGRMERIDYDASDLIGNAGGVIEVLVEQPDREMGRTRLHEVRFAYARRDPGPGVEAEPVYRRVPTVVLGPFVNMPEPATFAITFETDAPVHAALALAFDDGSEMVVTGGEATTAHRFDLPDMPPGRVVQYQPVLLSAEHEVLHQRGWAFQTQPGPDDHFRFAVLSDSRQGVGPAWEVYEGTNARAVRHFFLAALRMDARFIVFPGDLIDGYTTQESEWRLQARHWQESAQYVGRYLPIFEGFGNHEILMEAWENGFARSPVEGSPEGLFTETFVTPRNGPLNEGPGTTDYGGTVYSWGYGNSHFVMLNADYWWSNQDDTPGVVRPEPRQNRMGFIMDEQIAWLDRDLAAARERGAQHLFVFTHHPAFPQSFHWHGSMYYRGAVPEVLEQRDKLLEVMLRHGVLAFITGHEHNYSRMLVGPHIDEAYDGRMWQLITGGCGAPHYALRDTLPWSEHVLAYSAQENFVLIDVRGDRVFARVLSNTDEEIDTFELTAFPETP